MSTISQSPVYISFTATLQEDLDSEGSYYTAPHSYIDTEGENPLQRLEVKCKALGNIRKQTTISPYLAIASNSFALAILKSAKRTVGDTREHYPSLDSTKDSNKAKEAFAIGAKLQEHRASIFPLRFKKHCIVNTSRSGFTYYLTSIFKEKIEAYNTVCAQLEELKSLVRLNGVSSELFDSEYAPNGLPTPISSELVMSDRELQILRSMR